MKILSYSYRGTPSWGALVDQRIVDLGAASGGKYPTLRSALAALRVEDIEQLADGAEGQIPLQDVTLLPVVPDAPRIFCVGLNYEEHRVEAKRDKTGHPTIFLRVAGSQVGHAQPIVLPRESTSLDYEGEIAIVIGKSGRRIAEQEAWAYVAGYAPYNDASVRDWQAHTTQWTPGKNFPGTGAFGPWMVTRGEVRDEQPLSLTTRLNGETVQHATTEQLIFSIPRLIAYISTFTALEPGDVIVTGTPGGVGFKRQPPLFLRHGDVVEVDVGGVATLRNTVQAE
jgi:2-keto-4-pentenoate hydratase/2-oxohepta-3-ene-1,7-dioic acid hydratase in catechol pathway